MPFLKTGPNTYRSPSGRLLNTRQVAGYYANRGNYPGSPGMRDQFGPSAIMSPTAPGKAKKPKLDPSGKTNAATSQTPTSILNGGKQSFAPLEYATSGREDEQRALFERARNLRVPKPKRRK